MKGGYIMLCTIGSINQVHKRLNENGFAVSKGFLRQLVASNQLPSMKSGNKVLLNYDSVVELLLTRTTISEKVTSSV